MQRDECNDKSPLLTVAIPTYRGAAYIGAAIASVLAQNFVDFELLVIDDQSPDDTQSILAGFSDPRIRYLKNPINLGPEGNWNRCLELARGKYFKLLPHDDTLKPNCLGRQVAVLEADTALEIALVFGVREVLGPRAEVLTRRGYPGAREGALLADEVMRTCVRRGTNLVGEPGAVTFRKSLAKRIGPFDATNPYVIDLDYWFRLMAHGRAYYCNEVVSTFRLSKGSLECEDRQQPSHRLSKFCRSSPGRQFVFPHRIRSPLWSLYAQVKQRGPLDLLSPLCSMSRAAAF